VPSSDDALSSFKVFPSLDASRAQASARGVPDARGGQFRWSLGAAVVKIKGGMGTETKRYLREERRVITP
jgi:hypothetical protein